MSYVKLNPRDPRQARYMKKREREHAEHTMPPWKIRVDHVKFATMAVSVLRILASCYLPIQMVTVSGHNLNEVVRSITMGVFQELRRVPDLDIVAYVRNALSEWIHRCSAGDFPQFGLDCPTPRIPRWAENAAISNLPTTQDVETGFPFSRSHRDILAIMRLADLTSVPKASPPGLLTGPDPRLDKNLRCLRPGWSMPSNVPHKKPDEHERSIEAQTGM